MKKLYKKIDGVLHYKEAWVDEDECTVHWGIVGREGEHETYEIDGEYLKEPAVENVLARAVKDGYQEIGPDDHVLVIVQIKLRPEWEGSRALKKLQEEIEELLRQCLGWTCNGNGNGGNVGDETISFFTFVIDPQLACKTIVETLTEVDLIEDTVIVYLTPQQTHQPLWPADYDAAEFTVY